MFPKGIERDQWHEMDSTTAKMLSANIFSLEKNLIGISIGQKTLISDT